MTEQETREKIVEVLKKSREEWEIITPSIGILDEPRVDIEIDKLADALIAAGYGDVKEIKYRVRRAEKALYIACRETAEIIFKDDFDRHAQEYMYGYLIQAENELAEEKENEER